MHSSHSGGTVANILQHINLNLKHFSFTVILGKILNALGKDTSVISFCKEVSKRLKPFIWKKH